MGATFSALRRWIFDHLLHRERSYRGTLLGLRHGIDLVRLVGHLADELGEVELSVWCDQWLERRLGRIEAAEEQLAWFARHAETAAEAV